MKTTALLLVAALALGATPVRAEDAAAPKQRGFLTGLGLGLLIGGLVGVGAGVGGLVSANEAFERLSAYGPASAQEMPSVTALQARVGGSTSLAVVGFVGGALALAGGLTCILLDNPRASVAFMPTAQGGVIVFSGRF